MLDEMNSSKKKILATIFCAKVPTNQTLPTFAGIFEQRHKILETKWQNANPIRLI